MTYFTICREVGSNVIRICRCIVICEMTAHTGIWCVDITPLMAGITIIGNGSMGSGERIHVVVIKVGWSPGRL